MTDEERQKDEIYRTARRELDRARRQREPIAEVCACRRRAFAYTREGPVCVDCLARQMAGMPPKG